MLTDLQIKKLSLPAKRVEIPDGKIAGLYLVHQPSGAKSWAVRYRVDGAPKKLTLGSYPALDLANARRRAQEALGEVARGKDPAGIKRESRAAVKASRQAETDVVERVVDLYVERYSKRETRDWRETQRLLNREIVGPWRGRRLSSIGRSDVYALLDAIADRGSPSSARHAFAAFRGMCGWAVKRGLVDRSPAEGVVLPAAPPSRDRTLSDAETGLFYRAFESVGGPFGTVGRLLFLTGARKSEVSGLKWSELDLAARTWRLPKERSKNGREHTVPLSDAAIRILEGLPRVENCDFVFTVTGRAPVCGWTKAKAHIDAAILSILRDEACSRRDDPDQATPPPPWTYHDIRRTVATGLQKLGVRLEVTEAVLNHVGGSRGGIVSVYQRYQFEPEKRQALDAWARRLEEIVVGGPRATPESNVVALTKARG
jgi:integrase